MQPAETRDDGLVLAERPVAGERGEVGDQVLDVIREVRPLRVPRDLRLLPRRQRRVEIGQGPGGLRLEPHHFLADRRRVAVQIEGAKLVDLGFQVGDGLFKIEVGSHSR